MYKVCGFTNYECTCGEEQLFGIELHLEDAISLYLSLLKDKDSLDFSELDALIDEWAVLFDWSEDDYYAGSYGGCIILFDEAVNERDCDREVIFIRVERDPIKKTNNYGKVELGGEITDLEKNTYIRLHNS